MTLQTQTTPQRPQGTASPDPALDAKGRKPTLYPKGSPSCPRCGELLPRVFHTEFRRSLGRDCSWSVLDSSKVKFYQGLDYHEACV